MELVKERGVGHRRLRVADQHCRAGAGFIAAYRPCVAELGTFVAAQSQLSIFAKPVFTHVGLSPSQPSWVYVLVLHDSGRFVDSKRGGIGLPTQVAVGDKVPCSVGAEVLPYLPPGGDAVDRRPGFGH